MIELGDTYEKLGGRKPHNNVPRPSPPKASKPIPQHQDSLADQLSNDIEMSYDPESEMFTVSFSKEFIDSCTPFAIKLYGDLSQICGGFGKAADATYGNYIKR